MVQVVSRKNFCSQLYMPLARFKSALYIPFDKVSCLQATMKAIPFGKEGCRQFVLFGKETALEWLHFCQVATASCSRPSGKDTIQRVTFAKWLLQHACFLFSRKLCCSFWQGSYAFPFGKEVLLSFAFLLTRRSLLPFVKEALLFLLSRKLCFSF